MKSKFRRILTLGVAGGLFFSLSMAARAVGTSDGDLIIGFYQLDEFGTIGQNTYILNLGPASLYRENATNNILVSAVGGSPVSDANIGADLQQAFGEDWADSGTVYWGVVGGSSQSYVGTANGDIQRTSYVSRSVATYASSGPTNTVTGVSGVPRGTLANNIDFFRVNQNNAGTAGTNPRGAIVASEGVHSSFEEFLPPTSLQGQFGIGQEIRGRFLAGKVAGTNNLEGALDVFRLLNSLTDTDLTSGLGSGNAVLGTGQYIGTFTIDAAGNLRIGGGTGGTTGNYASFALANGLGAADGDSDGDGIPNLVEYALNTNLSGTDSNPGAFNRTSLTFTKRAQAVANGDVTYVIEESDDLGITDPWQAVTPTSNTAASINFTLPTGRTKVFYRLKVTTAP